jgi:histidine triad (HIT) family protein
MGRKMWVYSPLADRVKAWVIRRAYDASSKTRWENAVAKTLFERLIDRELPCHIVYEDALVFAFLDIAPRSKGHTLLIPKESCATLDALSERSAAALGAVLPRLCRAVMQASGSKDYNVLQNNGALASQEVPHVHFHIIPRPNAAKGLELGGGTAKLIDEEGKELACAIRAQLLD